MNPKEVSDIKIRRENYSGLITNEVFTNIIMKIYEIRNSNLLDKYFKKFNERTITKEEYNYFTKNSPRKIKRDVKKRKFSFLIN